MSADQKYIAQVSLLGRSSGFVKSLGGFRKQHHTVPDAINAATCGFLAKLCAEELAAEAEEFFQRTKSALGYKRADLSLDVASPTAVLTAKDFTFELAYQLAEVDPASYEVTRTLHGIRNGALLETAEFDALFARQFSSVVFALAKGVRVEDVIDAIEGLEDAPLRVHYPSDCRHCEISVDGVAAELLCDGATLEMRFPRPASPRELMQSFAAIRSAFALAKAPALAGLL